MTPDTLTGGFSVSLQKSQDNASSYRPFDEDDDDDREVTAITALEIETNKAKEAIARMRDSRSSRPSKTSVRQALTPPPSSIAEGNAAEDSSTWNMRAIYNNSVFDIGMSITLAKDRSLTLQEAIWKVVPHAEDVIKVNITLITGELDITKKARYRILERQGQVVTFSKYNTDFSTIKFTALTNSTRFLLIAWRPNEK